MKIMRFPFQYNLVVLSVLVLKVDRNESSQIADKSVLNYISPKLYSALNSQSEKEEAVRRLSADNNQFKDSLPQKESNFDNSVDNQNLNFEEPISDPTKESVINPTEEPIISPKEEEVVEGSAINPEEYKEEPKVDPNAKDFINNSKETESKDEIPNPDLQSVDSITESQNENNDTNVESSHLKNEKIVNNSVVNQIEAKNESVIENIDKEEVVDNNQLNDSLIQIESNFNNSVENKSLNFEEPISGSTEESVINSTEGPIISPKEEEEEVVEGSAINSEEHKEGPKLDPIVQDLIDNFKEPEPKDIIPNPDLQSADPIIESQNENNYTNVESSHLKSELIVDNSVVNQIEAKNESVIENIDKEEVVDNNQLNDSLPQKESNFNDSVENRNLNFEEPISGSTEESMISSTEDSLIERMEEPIISPKEDEVEGSVINAEESKVDPIVEQIENTIEVEFKDEISNPDLQSVDPIMESQDMFKWMGLEGIGVTKVISDIIPDDIELILRQMQISAQVVVFTFIIAFNWCLMKILLSLFNSSKRETELRNICCKSERQIYYFEAEKQKLQTEIDREREKARIAEERMQTAEHKVIPLEKEFIKIRNERDQLQQKVVNLEYELESAAEAGLEANRLLNDFLTSQKENINLNSSVDALQQQITKQAEIVSKYESTAKQKEKENRELKEKFGKMSTELERMKNLLKETEHNLHTIQTNNEELKASKSELNSSLIQLEEQYSSLQIKSEEYIQRNEELSADVQKLTDELNELRERIINKDKEIDSWKQIAKLSKSRKLEVNSDEEQNEEESDQIDSEICDQSLTDLYDIVKMDVQLKNLTNDKNDLISKLEEVSEHCRQLTDKITTLEADNQIMRTEMESAVKDKIKAENKLEVLTDHYRAKELEFGKEIGVQQIQRIQKEETADTLANQLVDLKEENTSLRSQLQSMKKEIDDTERKYKSNINQLEKQVHENWILARNAERKLDESKAEAAVLRQTLTMSMKSPIDGFSGDASFMDDSASSISDHFGGALPPPPPPPMLPPPPLFNAMIPSMHMPFSDENLSGNWNQSMTQSMSAMPMGGIPPHFPPMPPFNQMPSDLSMNPNVSFTNSQPISFVPQMQQMGEQWDYTSNRDTYSPSPSHRSTSSPHSQYNVYSQPNSHYSNPMTSMSSPMTNSLMSGQSYQNSMTSVNSPLVNSSPTTRTTVLSEPTPQHWSQPQRPNGNISNFNYSQNQFNESEDSSRPSSRSDRNDNSLHTSIV